MRKTMALCSCAAATRVHSRRLLRSLYPFSRRHPCVTAVPAVNYEWSRTRTLSGGGNAAVGRKEDLCERPRRSLFSVPGADARKIRKAQRGLLGADCVVLDLEDGVARHQKDEARSMVKRTLLDATDASSSFGSSELAVRINGLRDTDDGEDYLALRDLEAVLPCTRLEAVVVPKVETAEDVRFVGRMIDELCLDRDVRILAAIESSVGMLNIRQIAETAATATETAASGRRPARRRLDALIFASEDYCADLELIRTSDGLELLYARSRLVVAAKAHNLQAIDMVHIQFRDLEGLARECQRGREMGFTGKQAIHPDQIDTIHKAFSPSQKDVDFALRVVRDYEEVTTSGGGSRGACEVDGIVVDAPVYKRAMIMLQRARVAGMLPTASQD